MGNQVGLGHWDRDMLKQILGLYDSGSHRNIIHELGELLRRNMLSLGVMRECMWCNKNYIIGSSLTVYVQ